MTDNPAPLDVKPKTLALIAGGGLVAGALIVAGAIMPAEYNVDPLGIGKATGLNRLWAPGAREFSGGGPMSYISDAAPAVHAADLPLGAAGWDEAALEYKVHMTPGQAILYRWTAYNLDGAPATAEVEFDTHGHDIVEEGEEETVVQMETGRALSRQGSMTAAIDGIYGWYFRNHGEDPVQIRVEVEGYFSVIPPGEPGNEFGIRPLEPAPAQ